MANEEALRILLTGGVLEFNEFRHRSNRLMHINFREVDLSDADLERVNFNSVNLKKANLKWANLQRADLKEANLTGATLRWTNLDKTSLEGANLADTIGLTQIRLETALGDRYTQLPSGLVHPQHWLNVKTNPFEQSAAPVRFIMDHDNIDVDAPAQPSEDHTPAYKESVFDSFKVLSKEFAILLDKSNIDPRTAQFAHEFAAYIQRDLSEYNAILGRNKFHSLQRCIHNDWDTLSDIAQSAFKEWKNNHALLEEIYPEAVKYKKREQAYDMPEDGMPIELQNILNETLNIPEAKQLLTKRAQDIMREIEAQAENNEQAKLEKEGDKKQSVKERTFAILSSFSNLTKMLEKIMSEADKGMARSLQIVDQAQAIYLKAQPVIEWAKIFLDKL